MGRHDLVEPLTARWRTSSFTDRGNCVAVAAHRDGSVAVRNSNRPDRGTVLVSVRAMHDWIAGIKAGEFDDLSHALHQERSRPAS